VFCIFNNEDLNMVTWEQRAMGGDPRFVGSQLLPDVPYARFAEMLGFAGILCEKDDDVGPAWDEALHAGRPAVIEFKVDQEVPPVPPHVTSEQAKKMLAALKDDPDRVGIILKGAAEKWQEIKESIPGLSS
jgi:pyruvate dehydrogenase (quinone)